MQININQYKHKRIIYDLNINFMIIHRAIKSRDATAHYLCWDNIDH